MNALQEAIVGNCSLLHRLPGPPGSDTSEIAMVLNIITSARDSHAGEKGTDSAAGLTEEFVKQAGQPTNMTIRASRILNP